MRKTKASFGVWLETRQVLGNPLVVCRIPLEETLKFVVGHVNVFKSTVQLPLKLSYGCQIRRLSAKGANQFLRRA